jgi:hypothetical protein
MVCQLVGFLGSIKMESFLRLVALVWIPKENIGRSGGSSGVVDFAMANIWFAKTIH